MIHSVDSSRPWTRAARCCLAIALLALMLAQTGCDDLYYSILDSFVCTLGGAGDCTEFRAATALSQFQVAQNECQNHNRRCNQLCGLAQQAVETAAEECSNQEHQFQSARLPGKFTCNFSDDWGLQNAQEKVLDCERPQTR